MQDRFSLGAGACLLALAGLAHAQTTPPTPAYKYVVSVSITVPANSAGSIAAKDKTQPTSTRFSPCSSASDQLLFTVKYDAGKDASNLHNTYVIFHRDDSFFPLVRRGLNNVTAPFFNAYAAPGSISSADAYTLAANNLGGLKTENLLGGELPVEGLASGIWMVTAIVAPAATVNFDNPATWSAWDTATFMLGKPWTGTLNASCS